MESLRSRITAYKFQLSQGVKEYFPITLEESITPSFFGDLLQEDVYGITLPNGYQMCLMEYLAECSIEFLREILKGFTIHDFQGDVDDTIDFLWRIWREGSCNFPKYDCSTLSFPEILEKGERDFEAQPFEELPEFAGVACSDVL